MDLPLSKNRETMNKIIEAIHKANKNNPPFFQKFRLGINIASLDPSVPIISLSSGRV
jgi:tRNA-dihydrouridine synthase